MHILLVEDEPEMRLMLEAVLKSRGHTVTATADGESGWESYQNGEFSMVILDWLLPGMDGLEVCRKIRSSPRGADSLVLVVTVRTNPGDLEQVLAAGADDYLAKPFEVGLLNIRLAIAEQRVIDLGQRREAEAEKIAAQNGLAATLDAIPDLLFEIDPDGRYLACHSSRPELLAVPVEVLLGKTVHEILPTEAADVIMSALREAHEAGYSHGRQIELPLAQGRMWFELSIARKPVAAGVVPRFIVLSRDITERKQAEEKLRASEIRLSEAQSIAQLGNWELDLVSKKLSWSDEVFRLFEIDKNQFGATYEAFLDAIHPEDRDKVDQAYIRSVHDRAVYQITHRLQMNDGRIKWVEERCTTDFDAEGKPLLSWGTVQDITVRNQAEQRMRELAAHLQSVREEEKADIAREIHDDMGGTLTAMKIEAHWLKAELSANKEATPLLDHVGEISQLIDKAMGIMRHIITGLRPTILDDLGLLAALEWQAAQFHKRTGIECMVNSVIAECAGCESELDKPCSIALFRIAQEALNNVVRHAGASRVEIEFLRNDGEVVMSIIDNGRGMTESLADDTISYGIRGMTERVDQLGGKISFDTPPGGGFNVTVMLPLA